MWSGLVEKQAQQKLIFFCSSPTRSLIKLYQRKEKGQTTLFLGMNNQFSAQINMCDTEVSSHKPQTDGHAYTQNQHYKKRFHMQRFCLCFFPLGGGGSFFLFRIFEPVCFFCFFQAHCGVFFPQTSCFFFCLTKHVMQRGIIKSHGSMDQSICCGKTAMKYFLLKTQWGPLTDTV